MYVSILRIWIRIYISYNESLQILVYCCLLQSVNICLPDLPCSTLVSQLISFNFSTILYTFLLRYMITICTNSISISEILKQMTTIFISQLMQHMPTCRHATVHTIMISITFITMLSNEYTMFNMHKLRQWQHIMDRIGTSKQRAQDTMQPMMRMRTGLGWGTFVAGNQSQLPAVQGYLYNSPQDE